MSAESLGSRWEEFEPWPEALAVLQRLDVPLGVATNCSDALAARTVRRVPIEFRVIVTAEEAEAYKHLPRPYELALRELGEPAEHVLFVAGSAYDIPGATNVGMATYWHNRIGLAAVPGAPKPLREERSLAPLLDILRTRPPRSLIQRPNLKSTTGTRHLSRRALAA